MTSGADVVATTGRLVLRTEIASDRAEWLAHLNTPEVLAFLGGPRTEEEVAQSFARMRDVHQAGGPSFYMVALKDCGTMIGRCGLSTIDPPQAPAELRGQIQIGWTIHPGHWARGYASEAAQAMLLRAFGHFDAPVVYGQTSQTNVPSWRLMEKLGMTRMAQFDYADPDYPPEDNPTMVYRLMRADWQR